MTDTKLLLVDATNGLRKSLEDAVSKAGKDKHVISFGTETEAMRYLRDERADLLLIASLDKEDVFSCVKKMHSVYPDIPAVTCMKEKTYANAKRAMEAGAFDYVSLPFSDKELTSVMNRVEEMHRLFGGGSLKRADQSDMTQQLFITRLMQGKMDSRMFEEESQRVHIRFDSNPCFVIVVAIDPKWRDFSREEPILRLIPYFERRVSILVRQVSEDHGHKASVYSAGTSYEWLHLVLQVDCPMTSEDPFIAKILEGIIEMNKELDNVILTVAVCQAESTAQNIYEAHRTADRLLHRRHLDRMGTVFYEKENAFEYDDNLMPIPDRELNRVIRAGDEKEAEDLIHGIYGRIRKEGNVSLETCRYITLNLAVMAFRADTSMLPESGLDIETLKRIMHMRVLLEMENCVIQMAKEIIGRRANEIGRKAYLAGEALDYIHTHYSDPHLSLKQLAEVLGISIPYLTVIFRNEAHTTFTTYLTEIRIDRAKELLLTTSLMINCIAKKVGFSSSQYFSATFRKYTGMSPEAFRGKGLQK